MSVSAQFASFGTDVRGVRLHQQPHSRRSDEVPGNYSGYLHADAYTGYDAMFVDVGRDVHEVACWSHARRKFFEAASYPRQAYQVLEWTWQLSDIEPSGSLSCGGVTRSGVAQESWALNQACQTLLRGIADGATAFKTIPTPNCRF